MVEYGDYECPHCAAANPIVNLVLDHFGDNIRFAFRHFPLSQIHPNAEAAAESAEFCGTFGRFWEMHDGIYENQGQLGLPLLLALVNALGLSEAALREALVNGTYEPKVKSDFFGGVRSGVNGTPTFFINGRRHDGFYAFSDLVSSIEANLNADRSTLVGADRTGAARRGTIETPSMEDMLAITRGAAGGVQRE
jgi:protein-disulfide isomerase